MTVAYWRQMETYIWVNVYLGNEKKKNNDVQNWKEMTIDKTWYDDI